MASREKGSSPFYPGQPVPSEFFYGRSQLIERIVVRGAAQVESGKPVAMYVQGEFGIGKSSFANRAQRIAESNNNLLRLNVVLGGCRTLEDMAERVIVAVAESGANRPGVAQKLKEWLGNLGDVSLFGLGFNLDALKAKAPQVTLPPGMLAFLRETVERTESKGVFLVFDEINGIADNPQFAHFLKGLVDTNAAADRPLPLLLLLCGVEERRRAMIANHQPIDRVFDVIEIEKMSGKEMETFFTGSFSKVGIQLTPDALDAFVQYSDGFPKVMHVIGNEAYFLDDDGRIDADEAYDALVRAADEIGTKFVDHQVMGALRSEDYRSILVKIARNAPWGAKFKKSEISKGLTPTEDKKLGNFLKRMRELNVIKPGVARGDYEFCMQMVRLYLWLQGLRKTTPGR